MSASRSESLLAVWEAEQRSRRLGWMLAAMLFGCVIVAIGIAYPSRIYAKYVRLLIAAPFVGLLTLYVVVRYLRARAAVARLRSAVDG